MYGNYALIPSSEIPPGKPSGKKFVYEEKKKLPSGKVRSVVFPVGPTTLYKLDFNENKSAKDAVAAAEQFLSYALDSRYMRVVGMISPAKKNITKHPRGDALYGMDYEMQYPPKIYDGILYIFKSTS